MAQDRADQSWAALVDSESRNILTIMDEPEGFLWTPLRQATDRNSPADRSPRRVAPEMIGSAVQVLDAPDPTENHLPGGQ